MIDSISIYLTVTVSPISGINSAEISSLIKVFSTISEGVFNIDIDNQISGEMIIYNEQGKVVYQSEINLSIYMLSQVVSII